MNFWDASALVALTLNESRRETLDPVLEEEPRVSFWWGTHVEWASAIARRERAGSFSSEQVMDLMNQFNELAQSSEEVPPTVRIRRLAQRLLRVHPLKGAHALQLAAALAIAKDDPSSIGFVCLDDRLNQAAAREGFRLLP